MDLGGAPYAYTPFCDTNTDMEGFRFWKQVGLCEWWWWGGGGKRVAQLVGAVTGVGEGMDQRAGLANCAEPRFT